jgi:GTP 3',8-cyclase
MNNRPTIATNRAIRDRLGRPLQDLRISLTDECNFRCTYCMPEELFGEGHPFLPPDSLLSFDEIVTAVEWMIPLGVRKIKLTGGEPLLRPGVHRLIRQLAELPGIEDIGLITNGYHLPAMAERLFQAGLRRVTVSLDSIVPATFDAIIGRAGDLLKVLKGIRTAKVAGFDPVKVNMVVQRGINDGEVIGMARFARNEGLELRYIEYMDVGRRNRFEESLLVPNGEIRDRLDHEFGLTPVDPDYYGEVAGTYRYADGGRVGFISSMTQPFCGSCTRLRLSADGKLFRCLFSGIGLDIRSLLRKGESPDEAIRRFWGIRSDRYSEERLERGPATGAAREDRVEMYRMGG